MRAHLLTIALCAVVFFSLIGALQLPQSPLATFVAVSALVVGGLMSLLELIWRP
jgi:hypothetical protein